KDSVVTLFKKISPYLRVDKKRKRALRILENYEKVTPRNGKYNSLLLTKKIAFENNFFRI
ncbi:hypothetical protein V7157_00005, partial [Neobacillus drentensis]